MRYATLTLAILAGLAVGFVSGRLSVLDPETGDVARSPKTWPLIRIVDGETLVVRYQPREAVEEKVRLLNVDTPERGKTGYMPATKALAALLAGRELVRARIRPS